jgi:hypothetical protein
MAVRQDGLSLLEAAFGVTALVLAFTVTAVLLCVARDRQREAWAREMAMEEPVRTCYYELPDDL